MSLRDLFTAKDKKPLMLSFLLERDECSRTLCEFGEKDLFNTEKLIIVWKKPNCAGVYCTKNPGLNAEEAVGMLIEAAKSIP